MTTRLRRSGQRGFLLAEFVIGIGISAVLASLVVSAVFQLHKAADIGTFKLATMTESQKATIWLSRDIRTAASTDLADGGGAVTSASFTWTDGGGTPHSCSYALSGTDLQRTYDSVVTTVAHDVSSIGFSRTGGLVSIDFTVATGGPSSYDRDVSLEVLMRAY